MLYLQRQVSEVLKKKISKHSRRPIMRAAWANVEQDDADERKLSNAITLLAIILYNIPEMTLNFSRIKQLSKKELDKLKSELKYAADILHACAAYDAYRTVTKIMLPRVEGVLKEKEEALTREIPI